MEMEPEKISDVIARIKIKAEASQSNQNQENTTESQNTQAATIEKYLRHWGIADDCIRDALKWKEKVKQLCADMEKNKKGFFLFGPQGRRKTTCATAMLIYELQRFFEKQSPYRSIQFLFVPDLMLELQSCFAKDTQKLVGDVIYRVTEYDFLVMDGIGEGGRQSEFVVGALGTIIHHRDAARLTRRTVITSNYTLQELAERLDGRIASRISGMCEDYEFTGEDFRLKR